MTTETFPQFVAVGEALTDLIASDSGKQNWVSHAGGSTWNVGRAMAALGVPSAFAGAISEDPFGDAIYAASSASGLDLRFLQRNSHSPLLAIVHETSPPRYFFVGDDSADLHFDPARLPEAWMEHVEWVHFGGISLARQPLADRLVELARRLRERGVQISFDPNYRNLMDERYQPTLRKMIELAHVIKVSDEDLRGLLPELDLDDALATLQAFNPSADWLYTCGAHGASLYVGNQRWFMKALPVEVVDTVGAGDASIAGFVCSMLGQPDALPLEHLRYAVAAGAAACLASGPTPPTRADIAQLLENSRTGF